MNKEYLDYKKMVDDLSSVLSIGHYFKYSFKTIQSRIIKSTYFYLYSNDSSSSIRFMNNRSLLESIFYDSILTEKTFSVSYREFEWLAMMYVETIMEYNISFELLFIYINIQKGLEMFPIYHELSDSNFISRFNELREESSVINLLMKEKGLNNKDISSKTGLSISMVNALRNRKKDIKKLNVEQAIKLAKALSIDVETLIRN